MPTDWREGRIAELERELAGEDVELAMKDGASPERLEVALDRLRQLRHRIDQRQLEHDDWVLLGALVRETT